MNRIGNYIGLAIWFAGFGYVALCVIALPEFDGRPVAAAIVCRDGARGMLHPLCNATQPLTLPYAVHALGVLAVLLAMLRLLSLLSSALKRSRRMASNPTIDISALLAEWSGQYPPARRPPRRRLRPSVRPRGQFGLRGEPH